MLMSVMNEQERRWLFGWMFGWAAVIGRRWGEHKINDAKKRILRGERERGDEEKWMEPLITAKLLSFVIKYLFLLINKCSLPFSCFSSTTTTVYLSHSIGNCVNNPTTAYAGAHKFYLKEEEFKTIKLTNDLTFIWRHKFYCNFASANSRFMLTFSNLSMPWKINFMSSSYRDRQWCSRDIKCVYVLWCIEEISNEI